MVAFIHRPYDRVADVMVMTVTAVRRMVQNSSRCQPETSSIPPTSAALPRFLQLYRRSHSSPHSRQIFCQRNIYHWFPGEGIKNVNPHPGGYLRYISIATHPQHGIPL
ncbi:hypothetical protein Pcinc_003572 [Petrolisthes cinctipes]|uniref:Uncharacterized protein n=1 Tax=Petrolisthes cinctipes TaxID=88211 RepID=A0AAE1L122_PETCI|nr:hypothetical protein Pcinc_003572 [Petrolisthes cinctipes]